MLILGIVTNTHDSGVALLDAGVPRVVIEEERLNRDKKTKRFPEQGLRACLDEAGITIGDIACLTTPWHQARLRRTFAGALIGRFPASLSLLHQRAHPPQRNQIVFLNRYLAAGIRATTGAVRLPPIVNVGHHDSHAAMFFVSPFEEAAILVMDGYGDDASTSAYVGQANRLERIWTTSLFNSLGLVYTFVTGYLGFKGFSDEGKVMALASFGGPRYLEAFRGILQPTEDGRYRVDRSYFAYDAYGQIRPFEDKFIAAFGPPREPGAPVEDRHRDIAYALQRATEDVVVHMARALIARSGSRNLVLSGGVALNCVANMRVVAESGADAVWVPPCASDTGAPLGSALWHHHQTLGRPRGFELTHPYYGLSYDNAAIEAALREAGLAFERLEETALIAQAADALAEGRIVGWFQGRFEMGPRALGARSILADPRRPEMKDVLNAKVKQRESFRPFAPAVLAERAAEFFEIAQPDPFMTLAPRVRPDRCAEIAAAVHVDGTGRIQTVERAANPRYYDLIAAFGERTGVPVLLNTSFNRQEPIVARPGEAVACFLASGMDVLAIGDYLAVRPSP